MIPITHRGKLLGGVIAILGIGLFALPAGIISAGLVEAFQRKKKKKDQICPHCGKQISETD